MVKHYEKPKVPERMSPRKVVQNIKPPSKADYKIQKIKPSTGNYWEKIREKTE